MLGYVMKMEMDEDEEDDRENDDDDDDDKVMFWPMAGRPKNGWI